MVKSFDGETILQNVAFDIQRMLREGVGHEQILSYVRKKMRFLECPGHYKIRWSVSKGSGGDGCKGRDVLDEIRDEEEFEVLDGLQNFR